MLIHSTTGALQALPIISHSNATVSLLRCNFNYSVLSSFLLYTTHIVRFFVRSDSIAPVSMTVESDLVNKKSQPKYSPVKGEDSVEKQYTILRDYLNLMGI